MTKQPPRLKVRCGVAEGRDPLVWMLEIGGSAAHRGPRCDEAVHGGDGIALVERRRLDLDDRIIRYLDRALIYRLNVLGGVSDGRRITEPAWAARARPRRAAGAVAAVLVQHQPLRRERAGHDPPARARPAGNVWQNGLSYNCNNPAVCADQGGTGGFWGWVEFDRPASMTGTGAGDGAGAERAGSGHTVGGAGASAARAARASAAQG